MFSSKDKNETLVKLLLITQSVLIMELHELCYLCNVIY